MKKIQLLLCLIVSCSFQASRASYGSQSTYAPDPTANFARAITAGASAQQVQALLRKPDINAPVESEYNKTALMHAIAMHNALLAATLLNEGAAVNLQDKQGSTALHYAVCFNEHSTFDLLIQRNADINKPNNQKQTPLLLALSMNWPGFSGRLMKIEWATTLIKTPHVNLDGQDTNECTALMHAVRDGEVALVKTLLDNGADFFLRNKEKQTALEIACEKASEAHKKQDYDKLQVAQAIIEPLQQTETHFNAIFAGFGTANEEDPLRGLSIKELIRIILGYVKDSNYSQASATAAAPAFKK